MIIFLIKNSKINIFKNILIFFIFFFLQNCGTFKKVDSDIPINAQERARKAVSEGRGLGVKDIFGKNKQYEFSTSNPLWRASLEVLDFLPLSNVDYSGGIIISDWYSKNSSDDSIKISLQFLSNEIRSDSLKVTVFKKNCNKSNSDCSVTKSKSRIEDELKIEILKRAATLEKENKKK